MHSFLRMTVFVTCIAILAACSRERQDWKSAQTADTIEAYGGFLAKHGDSALATQAEAGGSTRWEAGGFTRRRVQGGP